MSGHTATASTARGVTVRIHADPTADGEVIMHIAAEHSTMTLDLAAEDMRAVINAMTMATDEAMMRLQPAEGVA